MATDALTPPPAPTETRIDITDNRLLADVCGPGDLNIMKIEQLLGVVILRRDTGLAVVGEDADAVARAADTLTTLRERAEAGKPLEAGDVDATLRLSRSPEPASDDQIEMFEGAPLEFRTRKKTIEPRTETQKGYVRQLYENELVFGIGPAGTGKTYLAVAAATNMYLEGMVDRIILTRPAVEAGERLGFLPGDMKEKVDPYMQPLYDALNDFLPGRQVQRMMEEKQIEIAPLAFMRGRTLSNAFVILDEAQNATSMQMKMFLTRLGEGSRMVITGDRTQVDLPRGTSSGLVEAEKILAGVKGVAMTYFTAADVIRHPLVARIIRAYDKAGL
ncbi:phosphate starvation-inducible PhoH-like protein [Rubricella aquisinus]|uniref:PhoH-like protein n=1 Tax=Rubricella aquisinus TaxID=2028108 RepID=A0A840WVM8_9RHOB|nr:PhoH family protein [Rubricella aquisinus]MBB5514304.1 phosphate starvation-inducible PhoH-like protein [Rubricella aquisinus]